MILAISEGLSSILFLRGSQDLCCVGSHMMMLPLLLLLVCWGALFLRTSIWRRRLPSRSQNKPRERVSECFIPCLSPSLPLTSRPETRACLLDGSIPPCMWRGVDDVKAQQLHRKCSPLTVCMHRTCTCSVVNASGSMRVCAGCDSRCRETAAVAR